MSRASAAPALEDVVAGVFGIGQDAVTDELAFRSIPEWDSIRHVELMLALEEHFGFEIDADRVVELTTIRAIRDYAASRPGHRPFSSSNASAVARGLSGVEVDESRISHIDTGGGTLSYRGYRVRDLLEHASFEEVAFLLIHGELPTLADLDGFTRTMAEGRVLPAPVVGVIAAMEGSPPMDVVRTAVSAVAADRADEDPATGARLIATFPAVLGASTGTDPGARARSHAAYVLGALSGRESDDADVRTFERVMILLAEHGANASAFAARVAVGTGAGPHAAVTAALSTFAGPLHGGAIQGVAEMIEEIGDPSRAADHVRALRERNQPVLGLGHRLYTAEDPRATFLRRIAEDLSDRSGNTTAFRILEEVRRAMHPYTRFGIDVNVDFYAGLVLMLLGVPREMLTPAFACARVAGWLAHVGEQRRNNVLIRPLLRYVGPAPRSFVPRERRG